MKADITGAQMRAARGILDWSRDDLAAKAGTTVRTVARLESGENVPRASTLAAIRTALEAAGVKFIAENGGGPGVRFRKVEGERVPGGIEVRVQDGIKTRYVGELMPLKEAPAGRPIEGSLCGIPVRFQYLFGRVTGVCVETQAEADLLIRACSPTRQPDPSPNDPNTPTEADEVR